MKMLPGFIAGAIVGGYVVAKMTPEQRDTAAQTVSRAASKVRSTQVANAVIGGVSDVSGAAGERVSNVVSAGADAVADAVGPDDPSAADKALSDVV